MKRVDLPVIAEGAAIRLVSYGDGDAEGTFDGYRFVQRTLCVCFSRRTGGTIPHAVMAVPVSATQSITH